MSSLARRNYAKGKPVDERRGGSPRPAASLASQVTILMCTFNGERFLPAQLASIEQQSHADWRLVVSDDGSTDATLDILRAFASRVSQSVVVRSGPRRGPAANFMALATDPAIDGDLFAFSDQDDVWHPDKLAHAVAWVRTNPDDVPALYGARTRLVDADGAFFGHAPLFRAAPSFANALVQSIAGANTMLFNRATKRLLERAGAVDVISHDWWAYQLVTGSGGNFHYDPDPRMDYRQHDDNRVGTNRGLRAQWHRLCMLVDGRFAGWNDVNLAALERCRHLLRQDAQALVDAYVAMRSRRLATRLTAFAGSNIRRQNFADNVGLLLAVALHRI